MKGSSEFAVEAAGLSVNYGKRNVVKAVDLKLRTGEFVTIVGKSGCGKTTLLKAVAGLVERTGTLQSRGRIRMVFQEGLLLPWLTVEENIQLGLHEESMQSRRGDGYQVAATNRKADAPRGDVVEALLSEMRIEHLRDSYPYEISGGEGQRVAIARAFAPGPDIILMDEPFGALDIFTRERMQTWLLGFWERHKVAVLFVTHDIEEGLVLGDRLIVMTDGELEPDHGISFPRPRGAEIKYTESFLEARREIRKRIVGETSQ